MDRKEVPKGSEVSPSKYGSAIALSTDGKFILVGNGYFDLFVYQLMRVHGRLNLNISCTTQLYLTVGYEYHLTTHRWILNNGNLVYRYNMNPADGTLSKPSKTTDLVKDYGIGTPHTNPDHKLPILHY